MSKLPIFGLFQYRKSQADSQAVSRVFFHAVFWPCNLNPRGSIHMAKKNRLKNCLRICLRLNFESMTCLNYLFLDFFQYRKSQADSQAVSQAVFWPSELNPWGVRTAGLGIQYSSGDVSLFSSLPPSAAKPRSCKCLIDRF